jgi:thiol-disulfide isomerase/thioredoxin
MRMRYAICLLLLARLFAAEPGEDLPDIGPITWLREPSNLPEACRLIQFWSSRSPTCLQAIPALNDLQNRFGERLEIHALSPESNEELAAFLAAGGAVIGYPVGTIADERLRTVVGTDGEIPHAVLVASDGTVLWYGHPLLAAHPVAGLLERGLHKRTLITIHGLEQQVFALLKRRAWDAAMARAEDILGLDPGHAFMRELLERMRIARRKRPDLYP